MMSASTMRMVSDTSHDGQTLALRTWLTAQATDYRLAYLLAHAEDGVIWGAFRDGHLVTADEHIKGPLGPRSLPLPRLRLDRLQQCRAFGRDAELLLWRDGNSWLARLITEIEGRAMVQTTSLVGPISGWPASFVKGTENTQGGRQPTWFERRIKESRILWGTHVARSAGGFTLLVDGKEGLRHAVPLDLPPHLFSTPPQQPHRPIRLDVRHYLSYDNEADTAGESGDARLATGAARIALSRLVWLWPEPPQVIQPQPESSDRSHGTKEEVTNV